MPIIEELLNRRMPYTSGPAWLAEHVLSDRWVIAISGTHGKTTTSAMTAWLLESAGLEPGFLIGGVPANFETTARLGSGPHFVIEADEYDTAFFDKRAKFMHYGPRTLVVNNLEFDHADIYADMDAILWQFHQMLRIVPGNGRIIANANEPEIDRLLEMGCWTPVDRYSSNPDKSATARLRVAGRRLSLELGQQTLESADLALPGSHNMENATAAILAARHAGVDPAASVAALESFRGVKRRLEHLGTFGNIRVYDDFAHHPTAISRTIAAVRETTAGRVLIVVEPRSNSMKLGAHRAGLRGSLAGADRVFAYQPDNLPWQLADELGDLPSASVHTDIAAIVKDVAAAARPGDDLVIMSNGGFGGIHGLICSALEQRAGAI